MFKREYIFDSWKPKGWLMIISLILYVWAISESSLYLAILIGLSLLSMGWSITLSKRK